MTCGIYLIENKKTGQKYIGLSENIEKRWYSHIHSPNLKTSYIDKAIRKYGKDNFAFSIIEKLPNNRKVLSEHEKKWIAHYNTYLDENHYNLHEGGGIPPRNIYCGKDNPMYGKKGKNNPNYGRKNTINSCIMMSKGKNNTGYFRVSKRKQKDTKQGFRYVYYYRKEDNKRASISSVDINKLEEKVKSKGLPWYKFKD